MNLDTTKAARDNYLKDPFYIEEGKAKFDDICLSFIYDDGLNLQNIITEKKPNIKKNHFTKTLLLIKNT